jgi:hypothetical protein
VSASELLKLIPEGLLSDLAVETKVDHQVKKLSGEVVFKLILFSMLSSEKPSLRVMESFLSSSRFMALSGTKGIESKYNSIRDRICTINAAYFEKLFESIFKIYNKELNEQHALSKTDSTYVALATKLFSGGILNGGDKSKRFVKYSISLKGSLPQLAKVYTQQAYVNEDRALAEVINERSELVGEVVVFDRGMQSRTTFDKFTKEGKFFITRAKVNTRCHLTKSRQTGPKPKHSTVLVTQDQEGYLITKKEKKSALAYRLIKAKIDSTAEEICFITNLLHEDAYTIAAWYKQRWEIELFFKFLKQHLNLKHLVSRTENGIKVMLYMTLILAILLLAYKKIKNIKGYKIAKLKFEIELENDIIKTIVTLCGGDPDKATHLWNTS